MVARLIRPDNFQPAEFIGAKSGYICLRLLDTITPAVRWFSEAAIAAVNPVATCAMPPRAIVIYVAPWMATSINDSAHIKIVVQQPTVWHEALKVA